MGDHERDDAAVTPPPELTGPQKAWAGAVISTLATVCFLVGGFLTDPAAAVLMSVGGVLGTVGVPFGVYVTVNKVGRR